MAFNSADDRRYASFEGTVAAGGNTDQNTECSEIDSPLSPRALAQIIFLGGDLQRAQTSQLDQKRAVVVQSIARRKAAKKCVEEKRAFNAAQKMGEIVTSSSVKGTLQSDGLQRMHLSPRSATFLILAGKVSSIADPRLGTMHTWAKHDHEQNRLQQLAKAKLQQELLASQATPDSVEAEDIEDSALFSLVSTRMAQETKQTIKSDLKNRFIPCKCNLTEPTSEIFE